jgi:uncharacterized protein (TIGR03437 family)
MKAIQVAMAAQDAGQRFPKGSSPKKAQAVQPKLPTITPGGVVPVYSTVNTIQPGEWISIYGSNLAGGTASWKGEFPTSLGGVSVTINGKPAYLSFVSPKQINVQAPDDTATGTVPVVVATAAGRATSSVILGRVSPAFDLIDATHVAGIILRTNGSGAFGGGTYDVLGPTGSCLGYRTVAAEPGDIVAVFGVGFGPTTPAVPSGKAFSGAAPLTDAFSLYLNNVAVQPTFVGLSSAGLYQINLVVPPDIGEGDVPIRAMVGGMQTQPGLVFSLPSGSPNGSSAGGCGYRGTDTSATAGMGSDGGGGSVGVGSLGGGTGGGSGGGTGGGMGGGGMGGGTDGGDGGGTDGGGGSGGGTSGGFAFRTPYLPRLRFDAKPLRFDAKRG